MISGPPGSGYIRDTRQFRGLIVPSLRFSSLPQMTQYIEHATAPLDCLPHIFAKVLPVTNDHPSRSGNATTHRLLISTVHVDKRFLRPGRSGTSPGEGNMYLRRSDSWMSGKVNTHAVSWVRYWLVFLLLAAGDVFGHSYHVLGTTIAILSGRRLDWASIVVYCSSEMSVLSTSVAWFLLSCSTVCSTTMRCSSVVVPTYLRESGIQYVFHDDGIPFDLFLRTLKKTQTFSTISCSKCFHRDMVFCPSRTIACRNDCCCCVEITPSVSCSLSVSLPLRLK